MPTSSFDFSNLAQVQRYTDEFSCFGKDYLLTRISNTSVPFSEINNNMRIDGFTIVLAMKGVKSVNVNMETYEVGPDSIIILNPDTILSPGDVDANDFQCYMLYISIDFLKDINFDLNVLNYRMLTRSKSPVCHLDKEEISVLHSYLNLLHRNTNAPEGSMYVKSIARNLMAALVYQLLEITSRRIGDEEEKDPTNFSRRGRYVHEFMSLVRQHYRRERSVSFYAGQLYISPKYLSLIIKEETGRSASAWIDNFVLLEAKNLLRFSDKNIQQIAYELNFSNQSSFGKYFKNLTGMSPSDFQKQS